MFNIIERIRNRGVLRRTLAVTTAILLTLAQLPVLESFAQDNEGMSYKGSPFEFIGDIGIKAAKGRGFVKDINVAAEDKGIKITFKEVLCDNESISIGFTEECEGGFKDFTGISMDWFIDGKPLPGWGGGCVKQKQIDSNQYAGMFTININESSNDGVNFEYPYTGSKEYFVLPANGLPDEFKVRVRLGEVGNTRGEWNFEFPASNKMARAATRTFNPGIEKREGAASVAIPKVKFTPSSVKLWVNIFPNTEFYACTYRLFDDKGNEIVPRGQMAFGTEPVFAPIDYIPEYLVLKPYNNSVVHVEKPLEDNSFPMTLSQGKLGDSVINKVEFLQDKTLIHFDFKPKTPDAKPAKISISDMNGIILGLAPGESGLGKPAECVGGKNSFVQEYLPIVNNGKLKVWTTAELEVEPIKELEVKIPLNK